MIKLEKLNPLVSPKIWGQEKWVISTHKDGSCSLGNTLLSEICELSYLLKYIETNDNLSIQVHPGDEYAKIHENDSGKTECWIILNTDSANDESGIYLGLKAGVTKKELKTSIKNKLNVDRLLNFIPVTAGDYFYVPYGAIHALGRGVSLIEAQQSSGVTYRVWDWNRCDSAGKSRELHIDKAMEVINFSEEFNQNLISETKNIFTDNGIQKVVEHAGFKVDLLELSSNQKKEINLSNKEGISILLGEVLIDGTKYTQYDTAITLNAGGIEIESLSARAKVLFIRE